MYTPSFHSTELSLGMTAQPGALFPSKPQVRPDFPAKGLQITADFTVKWVMKICWFLELLEFGDQRCGIVEVFPLQ